MAAGAGRRNILKELISVDGGRTAAPNTSVTVTPPSPDESLIQLRGHQRKSATYNYAAPDPVFFRTPTKSPKKMALLQRFSAPTRSSPRKRLSLSPDEHRQTETTIKRRLSLKHMNHCVNINKNLKALNHAQLVQLVNDFSKISPDVMEAMSSLVPQPDLSPVEERLKTLQQNVLKCCPRNIWGNKDGSFCFLRVRAHLEAFKKECFDYCRQFMESQHWPTVFEYILIAWKLTLMLPTWPASAPNKIKISCIKYLSSQCVTAFKKSKIDAISVNEITQRLEALGEDPEVTACVRFARNLAYR